MENIDDKPKGNMLQNENREDDASNENLDTGETVNLTKKVEDNSLPQTSDADTDSKTKD